MTITSPLGAVLRDELGLRLEFERSFDTSIEDLWSAFTESERLSRWFGSWTGDPSTGSVRVVMTAEATDEAQTVQILECVEPNRLTVEVPTPDGTWLLAVELTATSDETSEMVFTHRLAEPYDASGVGPGWHYYLDRLAAVVAGEPVSDEFDPYMAELNESYPLPG